jgi:hypothetical protein
MPWNDGFAAKYVNYTILVVPVALSWSRRTLLAHKTLS